MLVDLKVKKVFLFTYVFLLFLMLYSARLLTSVYKCNYLFILSVENVSNKNVFPTVSRHSGRMYM